jgi:hypothetical protein
MKDKTTRRAEIREKRKMHKVHNRRFGEIVGKSIKNKEKRKKGYE